MLTQLMEYGAVSAKVRALWGKRLLPEDYKKLLGMHSVPDIAAYLRAHSGWAGALGDLPYQNIHRGELEFALRQYSLKKYLSMFPYLPTTDHPLLRYPVLTAELNEIMSFMALASTGQAHEYTFSQAPFFTRYSKIKYMALSAAVTYDDMLAAVRDTAFYPALLHLKPDTATFPEFNQVDIAMRSYFFKTVEEMIRKEYGGKTRDRLLETFGIQADLINLSNIVRVKRFYPAMEPSILSMLLPMGAKLSPSLLLELYTAPDEQAVLKVLNSSYYMQFLPDRPLNNVEDYYFAIMYEYNRRHIVHDSPSIFIPLAYTYLQTVELNNLVHIIECVRYGLSPQDVLPYLAGVSI